MLTIKQMQAKQAKELEELKIQHEIANSMPILPVRVVYFKEAPVAVYKVKTILEALEIFKAFDYVLPMFKFKSSCVRVCPTGFQGKDQKEISGPYVVEVKTSQLSESPHGAFVNVKFWALVNGKTVQVWIDTGPDYIGAYQKFNSGIVVEMDLRTNEIKKQTFEACPKIVSFFDSYIQWGGFERIATSGEFSFLLYADKDQQMPASQHKHAIGQLENLAGYCGE